MDPHLFATELSRVLVIDDNELDVRVISRHIASRYPSASVQSAATAEQGLEILTQESSCWDIIFLDYLLPDATGLELLERLADSCQLDQLPLVMLTGMGDESISVRAIHSGAQDYLSKDAISQQQISEVIERVRNRIMVGRQLEQEKARAEAAEEQLRLVELDRARVEAIRSAVSTCTHEISNPLTGIIGMLQLYCEQQPDNMDYPNMLSAARRIREVLVSLHGLDHVSYRLVSPDRIRENSLQPAGRAGSSLQRGSLMLNLPDNEETS